MPTFYLETLGCAKNEVDSDVMATSLQRSGYTQIDDPQQADILIVNTCAFLSAAVDESLDCIFSLYDRKQEKSPLVVAGCLPSRYKSHLKDQLSEVSLFIPASKEANIVAYCDELLHNSALKDRSLEDKAISCAPSVHSHQELGTPTDHLRSFHKSYAFVKIAEGCDRFCSFCAIPLIRGRFVSRTKKDIMSEIITLAQHGTKECVLVAQDPLSWGRERGESYAELVRALDEAVAPYHIWLRGLYLFPDDLSDEIIEAFAAARSFVPYFDIPIQHVSKHILEAMHRRPHTPEFFAQKIASIREKLPDAAIRTTALVGFPGETQQDVDELASFMREIKPDYLSVFSYSQEEGTAAAQFASQISSEVKREREQRFIDLSEELGFAAAQKRVGSVADVLLDAYDEDEDKLVGHAWFQAPDTDGVVYLPQHSAKVGERVSAKLIDSVCYDFEGERI